MSDLDNWLDNHEYLPEFIRDFHAQKALFKTIHYVYRNSEDKKRAPDWITGHCYVIDWFLWYMAARGYTLQKSRKKLNFYTFESWREIENKLPSPLKQNTEEETCNESQQA